jgi:hypothetical protein
VCSTKQLRRAFPELGQISAHDAAEVVALVPGSISREAGPSRGRSALTACAAKDVQVIHPTALRTLRKSIVPLISASFWQTTASSIYS